jgi:anti-sigma B factor antagonist
LLFIDVAGFVDGAGLASGANDVAAFGRRAEDEVGLSFVGDDLETGPSLKFFECGEDFGGDFRRRSLRVRSRLLRQEVSGTEQKKNGEGKVVHGGSGGSGIRIRPVRESGRIILTPRRSGTPPAELTRLTKTGRRRKFQPFSERTDEMRWSRGDAPSNRVVTSCRDVVVVTPLSLRHVPGDAANPPSRYLPARFAVSQEVHVETAIGVFDSRDNVEQALKELLRQSVPRESIAFMTRSEDDAAAVAEIFGACAGPFAEGDSLAGVAAVTPLTVADMGPVFAVGSGASALLRLPRSATDSAPGKAASAEAATGAGTDIGTGVGADHRDNENAALLQKVLKGGRSLLAVRTAWHEIATVASAVLNRLGNDTSEHAHVKTHTVTRQVEGITVVDVRGRITAGEGSEMLRKRINDLIQAGNKRIVLNLCDVEYVDTCGIGELVRILATLRKQNGQLKLVNIQNRLMEILRMTCLHKVFDIQKDEASAVRSFRGMAIASA